MRRNARQVYWFNKHEWMLNSHCIKQSTFTNRYWLSLIWTTHLTHKVRSHAPPETPCNNIPLCSPTHFIRTTAAKSQLCKHVHTFFKLMEASLLSVFSVWLRTHCGGRAAPLLSAVHLLHSLLSFWHMRTCSCVYIRFVCLLPSITFTRLRHCRPLPNYS